MANRKKKASKSDVAAPCDPRSPCPVSCVLDLIGDKWTLLVVRDLMFGKKTYGDLANSPEGIPTNLLANRLKRLVDAGLVEKEAYQKKPPRYEYRLTHAGAALKPVIVSVVKWGLKHLKGVQVHESYRDK